MVCRREPTDNVMHATSQPRTRTTFPNTLLLITLGYLAVTWNEKIILHSKLSFQQRKRKNFKLKVTNFSKNPKSIDSSLSFLYEIKILNDTDHKQDSWQYNINYTITYVHFILPNVNCSRRVATLFWFVPSFDKTPPQFPRVKEGEDNVLHLIINFLNFKTWPKSCNTIMGQSENMRPCIASLKICPNLTKSQTN